MTSVRFCRPSSFPPGFPPEMEGEWSACGGPPEICNGEDDDCDGEADEGSCDDGFSCTADICAVGVFGFPVCLNLPFDAMCEDGATCTRDACNRPPDGNGTIVINATTGCQRRFDNAFCRNEWDGCDCNGAETCIGTAAAPADEGSGCAFRPRAAHPCEDDGDFCTLETCCELGFNCRHPGPGLPPQACATWLLTCSPFGETVRPETSETGNGVLCPELYCETLPEPFDRVQCPDLPCAGRACVPGTGGCTTTSFAPADSRPPGCDGVVAEGCGVEECDGGGTCVVRRTNPTERSDPDFIGDHPDNTCEDNPWMVPLPDHDPNLRFPHCRTRRCHDEGVVPACIVQAGTDINDALCQDDSFCNGVETCGDGDGHLPGSGVAGCETSLVIACVPRGNCYDVHCDEETDACVNVPKPGDCLPEGTNPCDNPFMCDEVTGDCIPRSDNVCDDNDPCTLDRCESDEFNQVAICKHEDAPPALCEGCPLDCDDFNACTTDECIPGVPPTCRNTPRICISDDPCSPARCNPLDNDGDPCFMMCSPSPGCSCI